MNRTPCPLCGHRLKYPDEGAGKQARCPRCGFPFRLPAVPSAADDGPGSATGRDLASLVQLNAQLTPRGTEHLSHFLDRASPAGVARFGRWLAGAGTESIQRVAELLNRATAGELDYLGDWWQQGGGNFGPAKVATCAGCHGAADPRDEFHFHAYRKRLKVGPAYRYDGMLAGSEHYCKKCIAALRSRMVRGVAAAYSILGSVVLILGLYGVTNHVPVCWVTAAVLALAGLLAIPEVRKRTRDLYLGQTLALMHNRERLAKKGLEFVGRGRAPAS
jgi:hypothetical protein